MVATLLYILVTEPSGSREKALCSSLSSLIDDMNANDTLFGVVANR